MNQQALLVRSVLLVVLSMQSILGFCQSLKDVNNEFNVSVPPGEIVGYQFTYPGVNLSGCKVDYTVTNAQGLPPNFPVPNQSVLYTTKWQNVNANAQVDAKTHDCDDTNANNATASYSAPIRYLGPIGPTSLNGSTSGNLSCGGQTVTFTVGTVQNATNYQWDYSNLQGWSYINGQGTNTLTMMSSAGTGGQVTVIAKRYDALSVSSTSNINVTRPSVASNLLISGPAQGCLNQSSLYSITGLGSGNTVTWSTTGVLALNGPNGNGSIGVNYGGSNGIGTLNAIITNACNNTASVTKTIGVGVPLIDNLYFDGVLNSGPTSVLAGSTHYFHTISSNSPDVNTTYTFTQNPNSGNMTISFTGVNYGNCEIYVGGTIGSNFVQIGASNVCGSNSRYFTLYIPSMMRVASNPSTDELVVEFSNTEIPEALPDQIEIVSEKDAKVIKSINVQEVYKNKMFIGKNKVQFYIKELPRGTYYLRVINPRQVKGNEVEMIRLVFN